ncbi:MAG: hypothetical protein ACM335_12085 [Deltaproteobacteria bacterium]
MIADTSVKLKQTDVVLSNFEQVNAGNYSMEEKIIVYGTNW